MASCRYWPTCDNWTPGDFEPWQMCDACYAELCAAVRTAQAQLDGTELSQVMLLTGFTADEIADLGGLD